MIDFDVLVGLDLFKHVASLVWCWTCLEMFVIPTRTCLEVERPGTHPPRTRKGLLRWIPVKIWCCIAGCINCEIMIQMTASRINDDRFTWVISGACESAGFGPMNKTMRPSSTGRCPTNGPSLAGCGLENALPVIFLLRLLGFGKFTWSLLK